MLKLSPLYGDLVYEPSRKDSRLEIWDRVERRCYTTATKDILL